MQLFKGGIGNIFYHRGVVTHLRLYQGFLDFDGIHLNLLEMVTVLVTDWGVFMVMQDMSVIPLVRFQI